MVSNLPIEVPIPPSIKGATQGIGAQKRTFAPNKNAFVVTLY